MRGRMKEGLVIPLMSLLCLMHGSLGSLQEQELLTKLFLRYNMNNRPVEFANMSLSVTMDLATNQLIDLDEAHETLKIKIWVRLAWNDYHLQWDPAKYGNILKINVQPSLIWKPDVTLYNDVSDSSNIGAYQKIFPASISWDGNISWNVPYVYHTSCSLDVRFFPYDKQQCLLKFGSWTYNQDKIDLFNKSATADLGKFACNGEWLLLGMPVERHVVPYSDGQSFVDLTYNMIILRKPLYYVFNLIFPCMVITATAVLVFCLPPQSGEKVNLGVTVLLALTVFLLLVAQSVPSQSDSIPLASQYYGATIALLALSTSLTVVTLNLHHRGLFSLRVPRIIRIIFLDWLATIVLMGTHIKKHDTAKTHLKVRLSEVRASRSERKKAPMKEELNNGNSVHQKNSDALSMRIDSNKCMIQEKTSPASLLGGILDVLRDLQERWTNGDEQKELISEWALVAMVMDRMFFILFVVGTIAICVAILLGHPNYYADVPWPNIPCVGSRA